MSLAIFRDTESHHRPVGTVEPCTSSLVLKGHEKEKKKRFVHTSEGDVKSGWEK